MLSAASLIDMADGPEVSCRARRQGKDGGINTVLGAVKWAFAIRGGSVK
jgi:hypothetical protein